MRLIKQLFFGISFFLVLFAVIFGIWYLNTDRPTCFDGFKNGDEEGVDCGLLACGAPCPPPILDLEINEAKAINVGNNEYDFMAQVFNPNTVYGAGDVYYDLILKDTSGRKVYEESKKFYILPGQIKYVIAPAIKGVSQVGSAEIKIKQVNWQSYNPVGTIKFPLTSQEKQQSEAGSQFLGVIRNDSDFDFDSVEVRVVVKNGRGDIIAVNISPVLTLVAHTNRHFLVTWPYQIPDFQAATVEVEADTNLFRNSNFLKVFGDNSKPFQKFY